MLRHCTAVTVLQAVAALTVCVCCSPLLYADPIYDVGDIIVADSGADAVFAITPTDPATIRTLHSFAPFSPRDVAIAANGDILVAANQSAESTTAIFRILYDGGAVNTIMESGGPIVKLGALALDGSGRIIATDMVYLGGEFGAIYGVDPDTGVSELLFGGAPLVIPAGVSVAPDGRVFVADTEADAVFVWTPDQTGAPPVFSSDVDFVNPHGLAIEVRAPDFYVLIADAYAPAVFRLDSSGNRDDPWPLLAAGGFIQGPTGVAVDATSDVIVADHHAHSVIRVKPDGSQEEEIYSGSPLDSPLGLRVVIHEPIPEPVPTISQWGLIAMTLLVLTAGTLVYARRRPDRRAVA